MLLARMHPRPWMPSLVLLKRAEGAKYLEKGCVNGEAEGEAGGCWVPGSSEGPA